MYQILPEDKLPLEAASCARCELSLYRKRIVWGEGNPQGHVFIILDNPGLREDRSGTPFLCGTRETLFKALQEAGVNREIVYISYLLKCRPIRAYIRTKSLGCMFRLVGLAN